MDKQSSYWEKQGIPNPGSKEALDLRCRCPVMDNNYGRGSGYGGYWIVDDCPLHAVQEHAIDCGTDVS